MNKRGFKFLLLAIGLITVMIVLSGCMPSSSSTYSVSGYVTYNGNGLSGVTISFSDGLPSVTTNSQGYWSQSGLTGSVVVTPSLSGYTFSPSSITVTGANSNVNFTGSPITGISITSVVFSGSQGDYTITINGNGFGSFPNSLPFSGDSSYLSIADGAQVGYGEWGYSGDGNILTYQSWSNTQIVVSGFGGNPGDSVRIALWNPSSGSGVTWGGNAPGGQGNPQITSVGFSGSGQNLQIIIKGSGFGSAPVTMPYTGDLNFLSLGDFVTHSSNGGSGLWDAGWTAWGLGNDSMTLNYESWSDNEIVIDGFSGTYGQNGAVVQNGDPIAIRLWNSNDSSYTGPQTAWGGFVTE